MTKATQKSNPNGLLDEVISIMHLKNDAALARALEVAPPVISKLRHQRIPVGASFLVKCHELGGLSFQHMRQFVPANA